MMGVPLPAEQLITDDFATLLAGTLPLFLLLIFILPVYNTTFQIVKEKESRTKESMRMMGLSDLAYWLSWFAFYSVMSTIIITVGWLFLCINCLTGTNVMYVWLWFWLYGEAVFA